LRINAFIYINIEKQLDGNTFKYQEKGGKWNEKELTPSLVSKIKENAVNGKYNVNKDTFRYQFKRELEKNGEKYNGAHGIRHTFAQGKILEGYSKQAVSEMMGHSREEITNIYLR